MGISCNDLNIPFVKYFSSLTHGACAFHEALANLSPRYLLEIPRATADLPFIHSPGLRITLCSPIALQDARKVAIHEARRLRQNRRGCAHSHQLRRHHHYSFVVGSYVARLGRMG